MLPLVSAIFMSHCFKVELRTYSSTSTFSSLREGPILRAKARCKPCFHAAYKMSVNSGITQECAAACEENVVPLPTLT